MKFRLMAVAGVVFALLLMTALTALAQIEQPMIVETRAQVPVIVELNATADSAASVVTITLTVNKRFVLSGTDVVSASVTVDANVPDAVPASVEVATATVLDAAETVLGAQLSNRLPQR